MNLNEIAQAMSALSAIVIILLLSAQLKSHLWRMVAK